MDNTRNKFGVIVLGVILLFFIVGGYFFMDYMLKTPDKDKKNNKQEPEVVDLRINKSKDYIYYDNIISFYYNLLVLGKDELGLLNKNYL